MVRAATRSAYLELLDEQRLVQEGYDFLDEKRVMLASRVLDLLNRYERLQREFQDRYAAAIRALAAAIGRHGVDGLSVYPNLDLSTAAIETHHERFLGISLVKYDLTLGEMATVGAPVLVSPEIRRCISRYRQLLSLLPGLAALECNLRRLEREFIQTDRRARALDNVLLPEIARGLQEIDDQLETQQLEEGIRVRHAAERE